MLSCEVAAKTFFSHLAKGGKYQKTDSQEPINYSLELVQLLFKSETV